MYVICIVMHNRYSVGGHGEGVETVINSLGYTTNMQNRYYQFWPFYTDRLAFYYSNEGLINS